MHRASWLAVITLRRPVNESPASRRTVTDVPSRPQNVTLKPQGSAFLGGWRRGDGFCPVWDEYEVMLMGSGCLAQTLLDGGRWVSSWYHRGIIISGKCLHLEIFLGRLTVLFFVLSGMKWLENCDDNTLKPKRVEMFQHFGRRRASKMRHPLIGNTDDTGAFGKSLLYSMQFPFSSYIFWYVHRCRIHRLLPKLIRRVEIQTFWAFCKTNQHPTVHKNVAAISTPRSRVFILTVFA